MKRLGILGGTFNPPHNGHIYIAQQARLKAGLERVLFIPCGNPPHKSVDGEVDALIRLEMTRLAIMNEPYFELCDAEVRSEKKSYTANTLKYLKALYPECELCFIVGGDSLDYMEAWYHPEVIFSLAEVVAVSRKGLNNSAAREKAQELQMRYGAKITLIEVEPLDISSSEIRQMIRCGEDVTDFVDKNVLNYIKKNEIYGEA